MRNGKLEPNDSDTLQSIYNKLTVNGELREPLTVEEQVLLFSVSKWIEKNVKKDNMTKDCNGCFGAAGDDCQRCQEAEESQKEEIQEPFEEVRHEQRKV